MTNTIKLLLVLCAWCVRKMKNLLLTCMLWGCIVANDVWVDAASSVQKWNAKEPDFMEVWKQCIELLTDADLCWVATSIRNIWLRRNKCL